MAAFVTLLIEYFAKPRLEVRKDRIVERYRQRRAATHGLQRAASIEGRMRGYRDAQAKQEAIDRQQPPENLHGRAKANKLIRDLIV